MNIRGPVVQVTILTRNSIILPILRVRMAEKLPDVRTESKSLSQLLTNTNFCINLFEKLENERNWTDWSSDWLVGERNYIKVNVISDYLKQLKKAIENVFTANNEITQALDKVKLLKSRNEEFNRILPGTADNSRLIELTKDFNTDANSQIEKIKNIISEFDEIFKPRNGLGQGLVKFGKTAAKTGTAGAATGGIGAVGAIVYTKGATVMPLMTTTVSRGAVTAVLTGPVGQAALVAGIIGGFAYACAHLKGGARGLQYKQVRKLYESLQDEGILAVFQTQEVEIGRISKQLNSRIDNYKNLLDDFYKNNIDRALQERSNPNREKSLIEAMELYKDALKKELEELLTEEPDLSEETRKKKAKRVAKENCKSFLKGRLNYTDVEADKIVGLLQN